MPEKKELSRLGQMKVDGITPELPECGPAYLASYLWEIGPTASGGMGEAPISHLEIAAWQANTGVELSSWEARMLRALSIAYLNEASAAKSPACPAPWAAVPRDEVREKLPKLIKSVLRG